MAKIVWSNKLDVYASSTRLRNSGKLGLEINISNTKLQSTVTYTIWYWSKWAINDYHNTLYFDTDQSNATTWRRNDISIVNLSQKEHIFKLDEYTRTFNRSDNNRTYTCSAKITGVEMAQGSSGHTLSISTSYTIPHLDEYTLTLKSNDKSNKTWSITKAYNDSNPVLDNKWPTNQKGWYVESYNTRSDGKGSRYNVGSSYLDKTTRTLYAQWKRNYLNITYNLNGGTINDPDSSYKVNSKEEVVRKNNDEHVITIWEQGVSKTYGLYNIATFGGVKVGYTFKGWSTNKNAVWNNEYYPNSDIFNENEENYKAEQFDPSVLKENKKIITLYAIWEPTKYQILLTPGAEHSFYNQQNIIKYRDYFNDFIDEMPILNTHSYELGYKIAGWKDGDRVISDTPKIYLSKEYRQGQNIQLEAIWEPISYKILLNPGIDNLNLIKNNEITKVFGAQISSDVIINTIEYELINNKGLYTDHAFKCWKYSINGENKTVNSLSDYNGNGIELTDQYIVFTAEWTELKPRVFKIEPNGMQYKDGFNQYLSFDSDDDFDTLFNGKNGQPAKVPYERFHRNGYKLIGINWKKSQEEVKDLVKYDNSGKAIKIENSGFFDNNGYVYFSETGNEYLGQRYTDGSVIPVSESNVCELELVWGAEAPIHLCIKDSNNNYKYKNAYCYIYLPNRDHSGNRYASETEYKWVKVIPYIYKEDGWHKTCINPHNTGGNN